MGSATRGTIPAAHDASQKPDGAGPGAHSAHGYARTLIYCANARSAQTHVRRLDHDGCCDRRPTVPCNPARFLNTPVPMIAVFQCTRPLIRLIDLYSMSPCPRFACFTFFQCTRPLNSLDSPFFNAPIPLIAVPIDPHSIGDYFVQITTVPQCDPPSRPDVALN